MKDLQLNELFKEFGFSAQELRTLSDSLTTIHLKKGEYLLRAGQIVSNTYYVFDGCLRTFFIDESGRDHTLQFGIKDWWISDYTAIFSRGKATMNIECIQNATLYRLSRERMEELYLELPALETYFRKKLERRMEAFHKRTLENLALSAKHRYLSFIERYPDIEQQVKNYHIASYLGITTESLSRIRKEMTR
ncbi:MAG: Crp/Fnr family transcriptional regulator [Bacteroidota bacterium]